MQELIDTQKLKKKFGLLLSKLYTDCNFTVCEIEELILRNDYFDFLEMQKPEAFVNGSLEKIIKEEFRTEIITNKEILSEFFWAGVMYMSVCINKRIPLRQAMLLCPLEKMLEYYEIYHEMSDIQFINRFMNDAYKTNILRSLRKKRDLTIKELSLVTQIPEYTLKYYEKNNDNLFGASFENIIKIATALNFSETYFFKNSKFIPFTYLLFENDEIFTALSNKIDIFYKGETCKYEFDGLLLLRITAKKREYVPELYLLSAIDQLMLDYSRTDILLY